MTAAPGAVVLCCPRCGNDVPDHEIGQIIRFYHRDEGVGVTCPDCAAELYWRMTIHVAG